MKYAFIFLLYAIKNAAESLNKISYVIDIDSTRATIGRVHNFVIELRTAEINEYALK